MSSKVLRESLELLRPQVVIVGDYTAVSSVCCVCYLLLHLILSRYRNNHVLPTSA